MVFRTMSNMVDSINEMTAIGAIKALDTMINMHDILMLMAIVESIGVLHLMSVKFPIPSFNKIRGLIFPATCLGLQNKQRILNSKSTV